MTSQVSKPVFTQEEEAGLRLLFVKDDVQFKAWKIFRDWDRVQSRFTEARVEEVWKNV